jgi:hypothetical protein
VAQFLTALQLTQRALICLAVILRVHKTLKVEWLIHHQGCSAGFAFVNEERLPSGFASPFTVPASVPRGGDSHPSVRRLPVFMILPADPQEPRMRRPID